MRGYIVATHLVNYAILEVLLCWNALPSIWSSPGWKFSSHVISMSTAILACFHTSISLLAFKDTRMSTRLRTQIHAALNTTGTVLVIMGITSIWMHKDGLGKPHIRTWHSLAGIASFALLSLNTLQVLSWEASFGTIQRTSMFYCWVFCFLFLQGLVLSNAFAKLQSLLLGKKSTSIRWVFRDSTHRFVGYLSLVVWTSAAILGLWSGWGLVNLSFGVRTFATLQLVVASLLTGSTSYMSSIAPTKTD